MKSMDIRSAFQGLNARKRKAAETEGNEAKVLKRTKENSIDESNVSSNITSNTLQQPSRNATETNSEQSKSEIPVIDLIDNSCSSVINCETSESVCEKTDEFNKENLPNADILKTTITNNDQPAKELLPQSAIDVDSKVEHSNLVSEINYDKVELADSKIVNINSSKDVQTLSECSAIQKKKRKFSGSDSDEEKQLNKTSTTRKKSICHAVSSSPKLVKTVKLASLKDAKVHDETCHSSCEVDDEAEHLSACSDIECSTDKDVDTSKLNTSVDSKTGEDMESDLNSSFSVTSTLNNSNVNSSPQNTAVNKNDRESKDTKSSEGKTDNQDKIPRRKKRMSVAEAKLKEQQRIEKALLVEKKATEKRLQKEEKELEKQRLLREKQVRKEREEIERKERERLKLEKKEQDEQRKQKEKEEKAKQKQQLLESKAEEKRKKDEERTKAAEEKKHAEEEKKKQLTEKERKSKEAFANFFKKSGFSISQPQPPVAESVTKAVQENEVTFKPFQITEGMAVAPVIPTAARKRFNKQQLDIVMVNQTSEFLYLDLLKSKAYSSISHSKLKKKIDESEVILITESQVSELQLKGKLFQFCDNIRPAYWGTWRKKSLKVRPRKPFAQDEILDYEVDSDEEWDEGGPGESLTGTEDEESEDDYEVDNKFFVPHGYLSAEEEGDDDDDEDTAPTDPDELKSRLKMKEREFMLERKKKTVELKPIIFGCFFEVDEGCDASAAEKFLLPYAAELLTTIDISKPKTVLVDKKSSINDPSGVKPKNYRPVTDEAMPFLIKLLHGNVNNCQFLCKEFKAFWAEHCNKVRDNHVKTEQPAPILVEAHNLEAKKSKKIATNISKRQLLLTIHSIAKYGKNIISNRASCCWWVDEPTRQKYKLLDIPLPNQWQYLTQKNSTENSSNQTTLCIAP